MNSIPTTDNPKATVPNPQVEFNAYTDAPKLHPNLILGSLHLLFWLFFHPSAWRHHLMRLDPQISPDFILADLNGSQWRSRALRRLLLQAHLVLPILVSLPLGLILWGQATPMSAILIPVIFVLTLSLTIGVMVSIVVSMAAGVVASVVIGLAVGIVSSLISDINIESIAVPTAISIAIGIVGSIASNVTDRRAVRLSAGQISNMRTQVGGIVIGVLVGVVAVALVRFGLTTLASLTINLPENVAYNLARSVVVGVSFGVALGWRCGIVDGLVGGVLSGLAYIIAVTAGNSDWGSIAIGLGSGLLFGLSFGVTIVLPYVLAEWIAGIWAGAWAGALGSWGRHIFRNQAPLWPALPLGLIGIAFGLTVAWWRPLLLYPFVAAWNLILYRLDQQRADQPGGLLRWHAAFWDELQPLPWSGLDDHLLLVMTHHPAEGEAALSYLSTSRQRWAAQAVQIELEVRRLETCRDVEEIGAAHRTLAASELAGPASVLLRTFHRLSQDVEAALHQTTAYHQRLALSALEDRLNRLVRELTVSSEDYAPRFYPLAIQWQQIVTNHLDQLVEAVEQSQEIDNPYIVGVPLTKHQEIFIGRTDVVARIEQLLLDQRRPPLLLYGQRRMGKTSLLHNLGRLLPRTIVPIFVDGQKTALASDYPDFLYNIAAEMRRSAERQRGLHLPLLNRNNLAASPFTCFNEWLDTVEQTLENEKFVIALLALDEFEVVSAVLDKGRFDETDVLNLLRHIIQHRPRFKVMLAGSHPLEEFQQWASYLINVQVVKIGYLEEAEVRQLIERPVKNFTLRYEPEATQRIIELTHGHPAMVQLLCYEMVTLKNEQEADVRRLARLTDVEAAVLRALENGYLFFADIQQNQVNEAGLTILRFIAGQGEGAVVSRAALADHTTQPDQLDQTLHLLLQRDLLERDGDGFRFQVELIRRWFE